jgi:hypothetical protein
MSVAALRHEFEGLVTPVPAVDWVALFEAAETLKDFERAIDRFESETATWRRETEEHFRAGLARLKVAGADLSRVQLAEITIPMTDDFLEVLDDSIRKYAVPFDDRSDTKEVLAKIAKASTGAAKFCRKQLRRIERVRVKQYNFLVDLHYALLAYASEFEDEDEGKEAFADPGELGAFLRKQVA